ncbi:MAG: 3-hydroxyisobutyrate dehydrogenase [Pseudonocardiales bacterium]|jgi:3-hydroxyisobutyrate dehydrogenase|nr:3-hydroxyisobutyrate dehydrogenase [Pseudonocardiales bacterium]
MESELRIAVLGTGIMGTGIARSLMRAGYPVTVWNRTVERAQPLAEAGATVATSARDAVQGADVVLIMLFDAEAVLEVLGEVADVLSPDTLCIQSSTIGLDGTARVQKLAAERGLSVVDAPVLGTKQPAEQGKLVVVASGDPVLIQRAQPVFDAIGSKTVVAGSELGRASALKLVCNSWVASLNAAAAQAVALAGALGLDENLFLQAIGGGASDTPYLQLKGTQMIAGDFPAAFALDGVLKDVELMRQAATSVGVDSTVLDALTEVYRKASNAGHGDEDMAAVVTVLRPER